MLYLIYGTKLSKPINTILSKKVIESINTNSEGRSTTFYLRDSKNNIEWLGLVICNCKDDLEKDLDVDVMHHRGYFRRAINEIGWPAKAALKPKEIGYRIIEIEDCPENQFYLNTDLDINYKEYMNLKDKAETENKKG